MTLVRAVWIDCDGCDGDAQFPGHLNFETAGDLRAAAKAAGWRHRNGRDLCPDCDFASRDSNSVGGES